MTRLIVIPERRMRSIFFEVLVEHEKRKSEKQDEQKQKETLYSVNEVSKRLGRAHRTIKNLIEQGVLKTTSDGLISEKAINDYLSND